MNLTTVENTFQKIRSGDQAALANIYQEYRSEFIYWLAKKYHCELDVAKDIYQITVVVFYNNVISGKLVTLSSSLKSYLFAIGKNKYQEHLRQQGKVNYHSDDLLFENLKQQDNNEEFEAQERIYEQMEAALAKMGKPCKPLLEAVYYFKMTMTQVYKQYDYKNEDSAKNAKYKCLQRLKKLMRA